MATEVMINNVILVEPKKRGRPKKISPISPNSNVELINRDDLVPVNIVPVNEPKKRGRPKKNITITEDTASESSETNSETIQPLAEPKKRGRPKKIQPELKIENNKEEQPQENESNDQEEVEGFYIKLDSKAINGYRYVTSVSDAEYLITDQFRVYDKTTFVFCGLLEDMVRK